MKRTMMVSVMCLLTVIAKAQIITAESIMKTFMDAAESQSREFAYNAEIEGGVVTAQYVYRKTALRGRKAATDVVLHPYIQYRYDYDAERRLASRTTLWWNEMAGQWQYSYRLDYSYMPASATDLPSILTTRCVVEYRRWNPVTHKYSAPCERTVYAILPNGTGVVSSYRRSSTRDDFQLMSHIAVLQPQSDLKNLLTEIPD